MMYRIKVALSILFLLFSVVINGQTEREPVSKHGKLSIAGNRMVDMHNQPIQLKGVSLGWHNWWSQYYQSSTVNWLKSDWNCNLIRAAIGVHPDGAYLQNPEKAMVCLYNAIDAAIENDMYVIVDWHSHKTEENAAIDFFTTVATKYKDYPNIIYEIFNEPEYQSWSEVKAYSENLIRTIRAIDPTNIILVGSPHWDQDVHLVADDPIIGESNIMYTLHFYAATHRQYLRDRADYALTKGIPLFVSECASMEATGDGQIDINEWNNWMQWMNTRGMSWVAWSISNKDESCSMLKTSSAQISNWQDEDLKEWATIVMDELKK